MYKNYIYILMWGSSTSNNYKKKYMYGNNVENSGLIFLWKIILFSNHSFIHSFKIILTFRKDA